MATPSGFSFSRMRAIMGKEFTQLLRDRITFRMIIVIPIMQLLIFGYAINSDPKHLPTAVLAQDHSQFARTLVAGLKNSEYFSIDYEIASPAQGQELLQQGAVQFVVTIPEGFGRDIVRGTQPEMLIEADATDPIAAATALAAVPGVLQTALAHDLTGPLAPLLGKADAVSVQVHRSYNPEGFSRYNIVPGLIGTILTMTGIMMTAIAITRERERGTMENLLAMPVSPIEVMAGKIAPYIIIGYIQSAIIVMAAKYLFGVPILGSLLLLGIVLLFFISCNMALGFTLSAGAQNQMQAMQMTMFIALPSILLSGFLYPFRGMPLWAQAIGGMIPNTYFIRVVRGILLKGNGWPEIWPNFWPLVLFLIAVTVIAMKRYRRTLD